MVACPSSADTMSTMKPTKYQAGDNWVDADELDFEISWDSRLILSLEDGSSLTLKVLPTKVVRLRDKYSSSGEPVYLVSVTPAVAASVPVELMQEPKSGEKGSAPGERRRTISPKERSSLPKLSSDGKELLREASKDRAGTVVMTQTISGLSVETKRRTFVDQGNARSQSRWRRALHELVERGLLKQRDTGGEVFSITDEGFRVVEFLE
jgi:hypothetical protein